MHTKHPKPDPLVDMGYEVSDVNYKSVSRWGIGFLLFGLSGFVIGGFIWWFEFANTNIQKVQASKLTVPASPNPLLQTSVTTKTDIMTIRAKEAKELESTEPGKMPIEEAMNLVASGQYITTGQNVPAKNPHNTTDQNQPTTKG